MSGVTGRLDATIVAVGLSVLAWAFLISPASGTFGVTTLQRFATAAYPIADVLSVAVLAGGGGDRLPLTVCLIDRDNVKAFNDSRGHQAGDRLLADASAAWQTCLPPDALVARYGGEEFGVLLPGLNVEAATDVMDRFPFAGARPADALRRTGSLGRQGGTGCAGPGGRRQVSTAAAAPETGAGGRAGHEVTAQRSDLDRYARCCGRWRGGLCRGHPRDTPATVRAPAGHHL